MKRRLNNPTSLQALADAVAAYESECGAITRDELAAQERVDRAAARVVRGRRTGPAKARRAHRRGAA